MKTLIAADEPKPRPVGPVTVGLSWSGGGSLGATTNSSSSSIVWGPPAAAPAPLEPYRTTAHVGTPVPEIEGVADDRTE